MFYYIRLFCWCAFWVIAWPITRPFRKTKQHNCLTWAIRQIERNDGYLVIRWCRSSAFEWLKWPHFLYLPIEEHHKLRHFVPKDNEHTKKVVPEPWFSGYIKTGDPAEEVDEN